VLTTVLSWLFEGINTALFGVSRDVFMPSDRLAWMMLPHYLVAQSVFFLGAAWFRKVHYLKTVGMALLIALGLSVTAVLVVRIVGGAMFYDGGGMRMGDDFDVVTDWVVHIAKVSYYFVLPVFCWFVAWLRVTEAQVSHGI
jgi:hypothetical protein